MPATFSALNFENKVANVSPYYKSGASEGPVKNR